ncbi:MAG: lytic transglycosylase domain-containing protein, partial [Pseudomonadota bacterium]
MGGPDAGQRPVGPMARRGHAWLAPALACLVLMLGASPAAAVSCLEAADRAARRHGVPLPLMAAIALVESGRGGTAWPWTLNVAGDGRYFEDREAARRALDGVLAGGGRNVDVGCFQINLRWHGDAVADPAMLLDPVVNADYAADFLARLFAEAGDWSRAAGHYHSRTPSLARTYRARVSAYLARPLPEMSGPGEATASTGRRRGETVPAGATPVGAPDPSDGVGRGRASDPPDDGGWLKALHPLVSDHRGRLAPLPAGSVRAADAAPQARRSPGFGAPGSGAPGKGLEAGRSLPPGGPGSGGAGSRKAQFGMALWLVAGATARVPGAVTPSTAVEPGRGRS